MNTASREFRIVDKDKDSDGINGIMPSSERDGEALHTSDGDSMKIIVVPSAVTLQEKKMVHVSYTIKSPEELEKLNLIGTYDLSLDGTGENYLEYWSDDECVWEIYVPNSEVQLRESLAKGETVFFSIPRGDVPTEVSCVDSPPAVKRAAVVVKLGQIHAPSNYSDITPVDVQAVDLVGVSPESISGRTFTGFYQDRIPDNSVWFKQGSCLEFNLDAAILTRLRNPNATVDVNLSTLTEVVEVECLK